jgi:Mg2+ and Co2+ transporter CorA
MESTDLTASAVVFAWRFDADGRPERLKAPGLLTSALTGRASSAREGFVWLHLALADRRARDLLAALDMPEEARLALSETDAFSQIDRDEDWVFGQISDRGREIDGATDETVALHLAVGPRLVVTTRRKPAQSIHRLRRELERGRRVRTPVAMLEAIFEGVAAELERRRDDEEQALAAIEARLMADRHADMSSALGLTRRALAEIGRDVAAVLAPLRRFEQKAARFDGLDHPRHETAAHLVQRFDEIVRDVRADAERARLLQDESNASANIEANRHLFVLTVLNSILLPATLVTGFFGMNTGGLLWGADDPNGTLKAFALCCAAATAAGGFMLRRGMFR